MKGQRREDGWGGKGDGEVRRTALVGRGGEVGGGDRLHARKALTGRVAHEAFAGNGSRGELGERRKGHGRTVVRVSKREGIEDTITHEVGSEVGEVGTERPKCVVEREVTVSFLRRLIEHMVRLSARSKERKELPTWDRRRRGARVKRMASSSEVDGS